MYNLDNCTDTIIYKSIIHEFISIFYKSIIIVLNKITILPFRIANLLLYVIKLLKY